MAVELYQEPLRRRYYAPYLSCAYLYFIFTVVVLVILPFFLSYNSHGFWKRQDVYSEHLKNVFEYKVICELRGVDTLSSNPVNIFYSTIPSANALHPTQSRQATVRSIPLDSNLDGLPESLSLSVSVPRLSSSEVIQAFDCALFFSTSLSQRAKVRFESLAHISSSHPLGGSGVSLAGSYDFINTGSPLLTTGGSTDLYSSDGSSSSPFDDSRLLDPERLASQSDASLSEVLRKYHLPSRNVTMHFNPLYTLWAPLASSSSDPFVIKAVVNFPAQQVIYRPSTLEVLLDAWVKYLSVFIVVGWLMDKLCAFIYFHQVVETKMLVDSTVGNHGGFKQF